jgi:hypothetical protein
MTVVLVCLLHNNQPWSQLVARCARLQQAKDEAVRKEMEESDEDMRSVLLNGPASGVPNGGTGPGCSSEDPGE